MLIIRQAQLDAFAKAQKDAFIKSMIDYARENHASLCESYNNDELMPLMEQCIQQAKKYELISEVQVIQFLGLMLTFGPDVDTNPQFESITKTLHPEHSNDRAIIFRFAEVKNRLHQLAKRRPDMFLRRLEIPTGR